MEVILTVNITFVNWAVLQKSSSIWRLVQ